MNHKSQIHTLTMTLSTPTSLTSLKFEGEDDVFLKEEIKKEVEVEVRLKPVTRRIQKGYKLKRGYVMIPNELRLELIESVFSNGETVKFVSNSSWHP